MKIINVDSMLIDIIFLRFLSTHLNVVLLSGLLPEHKGREERKPAQVDQSVEDTVLSEPLRHGVGLTRVAAAAVAAWKKYVSTSTYLLYIDLYLHL